MAIARSVPDSAVRAIVIDGHAATPPVLRMLAAQATERGVQAVVVGNEHDAHRAARLGVPVRAAVAPPMGAPVLARAALRRAFGPAVRGAAVAAIGPRAFDAARIAGARPVAPGEELPAPIPVEARPTRERLRVDWGIPDDGLACLLVASPPGCADARVALDIVGRAAVLGRPMTLIAHPGSRHARRAEAWSGVAGGAWRMVPDARAEDPELLVAGLDAALVMDARVPVDQDARTPGPLRAAFAALGRASLRPILRGDSVGARLLARAGVPLVVAEGTDAAEALSGAAGVRTFDPRRPNLGALALHAIVTGVPA
jgi:hypothetical protein